MRTAKPTRSACRSKRSLFSYTKINIANGELSRLLTFIDEMAVRRTAPAIHSKLPALWEALGVGSLEDAAERVTQIMKRSGVKTGLADLGCWE